MYVRQVTFQLEGLDPEDYERHCEQIAPEFLTWPGLLTKVWLADAATNTYGGVYLFESKEAADRSRSSALFAGMAANPAFGDLKVVEFATLDAPTLITAGPLVTTPGAGVP